MYTYYLRAEAFRRALAYQKRYLILLLGGFQQSEREILMALVHLGSLGPGGQTNGSPLAVSSVHTGSNNASATTPTRASLLTTSTPAHPSDPVASASRPGTSLNGVGAGGSQAFRFNTAFMRFRAAARVPMGVFRCVHIVNLFSHLDLQKSFRVFAVLIAIHSNLYKCSTLLVFIQRTHTFIIYS